MLQDHEHPVRFRNIWIRPLPDLPSDEEGLQSGAGDQDPVRVAPDAGTVEFTDSDGAMTLRLFVAETVVEGTRLK